MGRLRPDAAIRPVLHRQATSGWRTATGHFLWSSPSLCRSLFAQSSAVEGESTVRTLKLCWLVQRIPVTPATVWAASGSAVFFNAGDFSGLYGLRFLLGCTHMPTIRKLVELLA